MTPRGVFAYRLPTGMWLAGLAVLAGHAVVTVTDTIDGDWTSAVSGLCGSTIIALWLAVAWLGRFPLAIAAKVGRCVDCGGTGASLDGEEIIDHGCEDCGGTGWLIRVGDDR